MAGFLEGMSTQQKIMLAGGAGLVGLFMLGGMGKKKAADGGALGIVDVRRPTDDINAPAGIPRYPDIIVNVPTDGGDGGDDKPGDDKNALDRWRRARRRRRKQLARRGGGFTAKDEKALAHWKEQHPKPGDTTTTPPVTGTSKSGGGRHNRKGRGTTVAAPQPTDSLTRAQLRAAVGPAAKVRRRG